MKNWTIAKRIIVSLGLLCLVIAGISAFAISRMFTVKKTSERITQDCLPGVIEAARISNGLLENQIRLNRILLAKNE